MNCVFATFDSPVGRLKLVARDSALVAILWVPDRPARVDPGPMDWDGEHPVLLETARQLRQYFAGQRRCFDLPLSFGGTPFQRKVWQALLTIPFGQTLSYRAVARRIGHEDAVRAVGAANGRNPISIVAPCHRVVGSAGELTGFAGGIEAKRWLLRLEGAPEGIGCAAQASMPRKPPLWCAHRRA